MSCGPDSTWRIGLSMITREAVTTAQHVGGTKMILKHALGYIYFVVDFSAKLLRTSRNVAVSWHGNLTWSDQNDTSPVVPVTLHRIVVVWNHYDFNIGCFSSVRNLRNFFTIMTHLCHPCKMNNTWHNVGKYLSFFLGCAQQNAMRFKLCRIFEACSLDRTFQIVQNTFHKILVYIKS